MSNDLAVDCENELVNTRGIKIEVRHSHHHIRNVSLLEWADSRAGSLLYGWPHNRSNAKIPATGAGRHNPDFVLAFKFVSVEENANDQCERRDGHRKRRNRNPVNSPAQN